MCKIKSLIVAIFLILPVVVVAQNKPKPSSEAKEEATKHYNAAEIHFRLKEFEQAAKEYEAAYRLIPDAAFLYNIAQCHRLQNNIEEAYIRFKIYLDASPYAPNRAEVEGYLVELDKQIEEKKKQEEEIRKAEEEKKRKEEALRKADEELKKVEEDRRRKEEEDRLKNQGLTNPAALDSKIVVPSTEKNTNRTLLWLGVGVGGVAALAGAAVGVFSLSKSKQPNADFREPFPIP